MRTGIAAIALAAITMAGMIGSGEVNAAVSDGALSDGNNLLLECQALGRVMDGQGNSSFSTGHCLGLVQGVADMLIAYQTLLPKPTFCLPSNVTYGQGARIITKYLQDHPVELNKRDSTLVLIALQDAYPCE